MTRLLLVALALAISAMSSIWSPVFATGTATYVAAFDPYFIGHKQKDCVIAVNYGDKPISVLVEAFDPFSGAPLDRRSIDEILPGEGAKVIITRTIDGPHASRLMVYVTEVNDNNESDETALDTTFDRAMPATITRLLVTDKHETVWQAKGKLRLLDGDTQQ